MARVTFLKRGFRPLPPCGSCPVLLDKTQTEEQGIKRHAHRSLVPPLAASLTPPFLALGFQQGPRWYFLVFSSNKLPQAKRRVLKQHKLEQLTVLEVQEPPQAPLGSSPGVHRAAISYGDSRRDTLLVSRSSPHAEAHGCSSSSQTTARQPPSPPPPPLPPFKDACDHLELTWVGRPPPAPYWSAN